MTVNVKQLMPLLEKLDNVLGDNELPTEVKFYGAGAILAMIKAVLENEEKNQ